MARWAEKLGRTRSIKTVNRYLALGSKVWRFGQQHGYAPIGFNPFRAVDRPREIPAESVTFTRKEVDAILKRIPNEIADYALAQVQTCWRPIELEALTWADLEDGRLSVPAVADKARRGKRVAITPELCKALEARRGLPKALIFARTNGAAWMCRNTRQTILKGSDGRCRGGGDP